MPEPRRRHRGALRSPLLWRIMAVNVLVLLIPVAGLLHLQTYRDNLIGAELASLRTQAGAYAAALGNSATKVGDPPHEERLRAGAARRTLRALTTGRRVRVRVFGPSGRVMADSAALPGQRGVEVERLPPPSEQWWLPRALARAYRWFTQLLPGLGERPAYPGEAGAKAYAEVRAALHGRGGSGVYRTADGELMLTVTAPVQRYRKVLGALLVARSGEEVRAAVRERRAAILAIFGVALAVTLLLSWYLSRAIARPMRRLAEAADAVRTAHGRTVTIPDLSRRGDEIGDLSAALKEMTEALWDRLDAIERFAAEVAHEIKNPLTSVRSAVETAARIDDPDKQQRLMEIILEDVQRLDRLISDISDASRLDAELSRAAGEPVALAEVLTALVEVQRAGTGDGGPAFVLELPGAAGGEPDSLTVPGLEGRLAQVLRNLLANAATFAAATVTVRAAREAGGVRVEVLDDGPGLPDAKREAIFERFYSDREHAGRHSGLGLAICKQIVDAHGGTIAADNRTDTDGTVLGAVFSVWLPEARS